MINIDSPCAFCAASPNMPPGTQTPEKTVTPETFKQHKAALIAPTNRTHWNASFNKDRLIDAIKNRDHTLFPEVGEQDWDQFSQGHLQELLQMSDKLFDATHPVNMTDPLPQDDVDADTKIDPIKNEPDAEADASSSLSFLGFDDRVQGEFGDGSSTRDGPGGVRK